MFYMNRNLKTQLTFSHYDMDRLHSDDQILKKLKDKVEGRCHQDYGYLIQIAKMPGTKSNCGIEISVPRVDHNGCVLVVTFSAITFKAQKNDIIDIIVSEISQEYIQGKIGHAQVMIPKNNMPQESIEYRKNENIYIFQDRSSNEDIKIDKDSKVRCCCFEIKIDLNFQMKIMAKINNSHITSMCQC